MTAGAWQFTQEGIEDLFNEDWATDNHYAILVTSSQTPSASHTTLADVSANECADSDYDPQDITGETASQSSGTVTLDCDDIDFGAAVTITAKYCYILRGTVAGKTSTDRIVCYCDLNSGGGSFSSTSNPYRVVIHSSGIATAVQS